MDGRSPTRSTTTTPRRSRPWVCVTDLYGVLASARRFLADLPEPRTDRTPPGAAASTLGPRLGHAEGRYSKAMPREHPNAELIRDFHEHQTRFYAGGEQEPARALL